MRKLGQGLEVSAYRHWFGDAVFYGPRNDLESAGGDDIVPIPGTSAGPAAAQFLGR